jgi:drug/metabolite transporter (DMT)-like permease
MLARPPANMRGADRPAWNWAQFLLVQCVFGICWTFLSVGVAEVIEPARSPQWSWSLVVTIVFVAVGPSIIAFRAWGLAVAEAGPAIAAVFNNLTPLFAAVLSAAVMGEWPQTYHAVAFSLIVIGILVSTHALRQSTK